MTDPDDQIRSAFDALREEVSKVNANAAHEQTTKSALPKWLAPVVGLVAIIAVAAIGLAVLNQDEPPETVTAPTDTTLPADTTSTTSTTTQPDDSTGLLTPSEDGFYPWIFPPPFNSWYEEGCPSQDDVIVSFMSNIFGDPDPTYESLSATDETGNRRFAVYARGENGVVTDNATILTLALTDPGPYADDCDAWGLVEAQSPEDVTISSIDIGTNETTFATELTVLGEGHGFEALIDVRLLDDSYTVIGDGGGMGSNAEDLEPYEAVAVLDKLPIDSNVIVIASSSTAADGAIPPFAARKIKLSADVAAVAPSTLPDGQVDPAGDPVAVRGVAIDDTLNVRASAGTGAAVIGTLPPYSMTATSSGESTNISGSPWERVGHWFDDAIDGWVNTAFLVEIEGEVPNADFLQAAQDVREAMMQNATNDRLADLMGAHSIEAIRVSADANIDLGIDPNLTAEQLAVGDQEYLWGYADGSGAEIRETVDNFFTRYESNPAITDPDRIVIDQRVGVSTMIDNLAASFPDTTIVEFYNEGSGNGFDWQSVRLAFLPDATHGWKLVAITADSWTT